MKVHGIHHVTAITAEISKNLEFYTGVLGLRLVKKSVNQDDVSAYHLFYADATGSAGTDMTFFDWPNAMVNQPGSGVSLTSFRVSTASLEFWQKRLLEAGYHSTLSGSQIFFTDGEGQRLSLVADDEFPGTSIPWTKHVPSEYAIRGILGVTIESPRSEGTGKVLVDILGFTETEPGIFETRTDHSFARVQVLTSSTSRLSQPGAGGVHHVAFRATDDDHLRELQEKIEASGIQTSGYVDRYYFHSIYFREPGGTLFEIATDGPGFTTDESADNLGENLALPPFLEDRRKEIEAGLIPLSTRSN